MKDRPPNRTDHGRLRRVVCRDGGVWPFRAPDHPILDAGLLRAAETDDVAKNQATAAAQALIGAGADVDHINEPRWTALPEGIAYGDGPSATSSS